MTKNNEINNNIERNYLKHVLIFVKYQDEILMLNREKPSWMGCWNGVGGKIEKGEEPIEAAIRETYEETGYKINNLICLSKVGWICARDLATLGGMYCYLVEVKKKIQTPIKTREGIIDFKKIDWLLAKENSGVARNVKVFLPTMLKGEYRTYMTYYQTTFDSLEEVIEEDLNKWWV